MVLQPSFIVRDGVKKGWLVPLLTDYCLADLKIYALQAHDRQLSAKIRRFVDFLARRFGPKPYRDAWRPLGR